ncbi:Protein of unknown function [Lentibacillus persicus]|uniref:DUF3100 domain-containing protein n=1 Tax=Lentibacillus persicus TaxID=640948 RepID=A0A1I1VZ27_9BACI|nr:DUF3100 domain-containing protein [Lentibacillus persicus]SFD88227.1 Protein of unknown function [Lentibacillus persicus]
MSNETIFGLWKDWRLHAVVFLIVIISEAIGTFSFSLGPGVIMILPIIYAIVFGIMMYFTPFINKKQSKKADTLILLSVTVFLGKIGLTVGPALPDIIAAGPALLLQEIGNLGTILFALPVAVWLGLKRESIGMTHSVAREPNVGLIMDKYGMGSPEGRGVMSIYIFGTVFGAVFMGLIAGLIASMTPLHPLSFAMASGIGSGTMMAAASGSLIELYPALENDIAAFAGASNLLSLSTGLYVSIFIGLPLTEKLYKLMTNKRNKTPEIPVQKKSVK